MGQANEELMIDFKDLMIVDLRPGEPVEIKYADMKRKRTDEDVEEALTTPQRLARSRQMKRFKSRLKLGRQRASRRIASKEKLLVAPLKSFPVIILKV